MAAGLTSPRKAAPSLFLQAFHPSLIAFQSDLRLELPQTSLSNQTDSFGASSLWDARPPVRLSICVVYLWTQWDNTHLTSWTGVMTSDLCLPLLAWNLGGQSFNNNNYYLRLVTPRTNLGP